MPPVFKPPPEDAPERSSTTPSQDQQDQTPEEAEIPPCVPPPNTPAPEPNSTLDPTLLPQYDANGRTAGLHTMITTLLSALGRPQQSQ